MLSFILHAVSPYFFFIIGRTSKCYCSVLKFLQLADTCELVKQHSHEDRKGQRTGGPIIIEHYRLGYQECLSEAMHFLVEVEGFFAGDPLCLRLINHLQKHCDKILKGV
jgi:Hairy Orange.